MKRKFLCLCLCLAVMLSLCSLTYAQTEKQEVNFTDVKRDSELGKSIYKLVDAGYLEGYTDGTFKPNNPLRRDELVKLINLVFNFTKEGETSFTDVPRSQWAYDHIRIGKEAGYIDGVGNGLFKPEDHVTREQVCKILNSINQFQRLPFSTVVTDPISFWAKDDVMTVLSNRIFLLESGDTFRATENITRAELCVALAGFVIEKPILPEIPPIGSGGPGGEVTSPDEILTAMKSVISRLNKYVIPELSTPQQKEIINDITNNMNAYIADSSHDYKTEAKKVEVKYRKLSKSHRDELKNSIIDNNDASDLLKLEDFFGF